MIRLPPKKKKRDVPRHIFIASEVVKRNRMRGMDGWNEGGDAILKRRERGV